MILEFRKVPILILFSYPIYLLYSNLLMRIAGFVGYKSSKQFIVWGYDCSLHQSNYSFNANYRISYILFFLLTLIPAVLMLINWNNRYFRTVQRVTGAYTMLQVLAVFSLQYFSLSIGRYFLPTTYILRFGHSIEKVPYLIPLIFIACCSLVIWYGIKRNRLQFIDILMTISGTVIFVFVGELFSILIH